MIPMFAPSNEPSTFAWVITTDHLAAEYGSNSEAGTRGPRLAPAHLLEALETRASASGRRALEANGIRTANFKMYDDDGELYYTGVLAYDVDAEGDEEVCAGPLDNFGRPNAGCTRITYAGHPEWEIG
jgi:hypothetical protein